jgi:hypothetical protein
LKVEGSVCSLPHQALTIPRRSCGDLSAGFAGEERAPGCVLDSNMCAKVVYLLATRQRVLNGNV